MLSLSSLAEGEILIKKLAIILLIGLTLFTGCQSGPVGTPGASPSPIQSPALGNTNTLPETTPSGGHADPTAVPADTIVPGGSKTTDNETGNNNKPDVKGLKANLRQYILDRKNPAELKKWLDNALTGMSPDDASVIVSYYEQYIGQYRIRYDELLQNEKYQTVLAEEYDPEWKRGEISISDAGLQSLISEIYDAGYKIITSEGFFYPIVDYSFFLQYKDMINDELYEYFATMALESDQPFANDAHVVISWDDLASRINTFGAFVEKYPDSLYRAEVQSRLLYYIQAYFYGLDNSPAFDYDTNKLDEELYDSYKNSLQAYPGTEISRMLGEYIPLLEARDFTQDEEIGLYLDQLMTALKNRLSDSTYRYYELTIKKAKAVSKKHDIYYPIVSGMEDKAIQDKINRVLYESISPLLVEAENGPFSSTNWADYQIQRLDDNILSITFDVSSYMEGAAHPNYMLLGVNINMRTGEKFTLDKLFPVGYDYKKELDEKAQPQIANIGFELLDEYNGIEDKQEFYLTPKELVVYFQPYVYTPYAYGPLKLYYSYSELANITVPR